MLAFDVDIPPGPQIIGEAMEKIRKSDPEMLEPEFVRTRFSDSVEKVFATTYDTYKEYEENRLDALANKIFLEERDNMTKGEGLEAFKRAVSKATSMEKSLSQSRVSRAGKSFETIVQELLAIVGIRSEHITQGNKKANLRRIDLVVPDKKTAIETPDKAHFLSLKTSLRERWREVVEEQTQGQRTHLLTLLQREILSNATAKKITDHGIILYVPDRVKDDRFSDEKRIRRLSDLPTVLGA